MKKKAVAVLLICVLILPYAPVSAAGNPAYAALIAETPVYVESLAIGDIYGYFRNAGTDEILDVQKCNYVYGEVTVNGSAVLCHVYMRTFEITDAQSYSASDIPTLTQQTLKEVKDAVCDKYLKCIAKTYYLRISYTADENTGGIASMTVKVFIACGEKTEDRTELRAGYIAEIAEELSALDTKERFLKMNELMLDGRFSYDVELNNRSSVVDLVAGGKGVCEEYAGFTALLLDAQGYENKIVTGQVGGVPHMWNMVKVEDRVYHLDILQNGPVDAEGRHVIVTRDYLLVSEETIEKTHAVSEQYKDYSSLALYDYVFDGYPESMDGSLEKDGVTYLPGVPDGLTVADLQELLQTGAFMRVFKDGEQLEEAAAVFTGCTADIYVNGKSLYSFVICVKGDTDGDGAVSEADLSGIAGILLGDDSEPVSEAVLLAADINGDGVVSVTDAVTVYDAIYGGPQTEPEEPGTEEVTGT